MRREVILISNQQPLDELLANPLTAIVFAYLREENRPVGVREVQRALNLSNPSSAYWHLNKLLDNRILERLPDNKYQIADNYVKIRKVPISVVLDHYFLGGKMIPSLFLLIIFLFLTSIAIAIMIFLNWWPAAAFTGLFSLLIVTGSVIKSYYHQIKPLSRKGQKILKNEVNDKRTQEITPSMILLFIGGLMASIVQLPIINEFFPIMTHDDRSRGPRIVSGGFNFLDVSGDLRSYDYYQIEGWTGLNLPGIIWLVLLVTAGLLCLIPAGNKFHPFLPEMELSVPGGLPLLLAISGGLLQLVIVLLIFEAPPSPPGPNGDGLSQMGLDRMGIEWLNPEDSLSFNAGLGFYVMAVAAILSIIGAVLLFFENEYY